MGGGFSEHLPQLEFLLRTVFFFPMTHMLMLIYYSSWWCSVPLHPRSGLSELANGIHDNRPIAYCYLFQFVCSELAHCGSFLRHWGFFPEGKTDSYRYASMTLHIQRTALKLTSNPTGFSSEFFDRTMVLRCLVPSCSKFSLCPMACRR